MKTTAGKQFVTTVILVFVLETIVLTYIFASYYKSSSDLIRDLGGKSLNSQATMIEKYLDSGRDVLWFAAETVDFMQKNGSDSEEILQYLTKSTRQMQVRIDENFTGIYGYLNGVYVDGSGWIPPADFDPRSRNWYTEARSANGKMVCSSPYVDAQTGQTVISFSQMLSDGDSVISLDIVMDEVQKNIEQMSINGMGYAFITDAGGLVIAHSDASQRGRDYSIDPERSELIRRVRSNEATEYEMTLDSERCTVFYDTIEEGWNVIIVVNNTKLFHKLRNQMVAGVAMAVMVFVVIITFCAISVKRIAEAEQKERISLERLEQVNLSIIRSLASTIDAKDRYTSGHSRRVADYAKAIAKKMGKSEEDQQIIYYAGMLHDVGKIRVPDTVINKNGKLTDEEFDQIRIHPVSGYHIIRDIHQDERMEYASKYHHERYDGKGYPNGLEGENIPEVARIVGVADAYDAMTSNRSYRKALGQGIVRGEILKGKGTQFDPKIADVMLEMIDEDTEYTLRQTDSGIRTVLVVDDEKMTEKIVRHSLDDVSSIRVIGANNAEDAMGLLDREEVDMILLDLVMPDVDGFALYSKIREKYTMPVVLMTADRNADTLKKIRELKIDDYITKPMNVLVLRETIHGVLNMEG